MKKVLIMSLLINFLFIALSGTLVIQRGGLSYIQKVLEPNTYATNSYFIERESMFEAMPVSQNEIVFLGDSITQRGEWGEIFDNSNIVNRGINSDTTEGVKSRLSRITEASPKKVFIMIGVNDLIEGNQIKEITSNYEEILSSIKKQSPDTQVFIQSVLPVNNEIFGDLVSNETVDDLNKELIVLANKSNYEYIDIASKLLNGSQLDSSYTFDGIHLNGEGYKVWKEQINNFVN